MKKIVVLLLIIFQNNAQETHQYTDSLIKNIQSYAQKTIWQNNSFTPDELQLLLNYCYAYYALELTEVKLLEEDQFTLPITTRLRFNDFTPVIMNNNQSMQASLQRVQKLLKARTILQQVIDTCNKTLSNDTYIHLQGTIDAIIHQYIDFIAELSMHEQKSLETTINKSNKLLQKLPALLTSSQKTSAHILDNVKTKKNRAELLEGPDSLDELMTSLKKQTQKTLKTSYLIAENIKNLKQKKSLVFYIFYQTLHEGMKKRSLEKKYFTIFFKGNDLIIPEKSSRKAA